MQTQFPFSFIFSLILQKSFTEWVGENSLDSIRDDNSPWLVCDTWYICMILSSKGLWLANPLSTIVFLITLTNEISSCSKMAGNKEGSTCSPNTPFKISLNSRVSFEKKKTIKWVTLLTSKVKNHNENVESMLGKLRTHKRYMQFFL